MFDSALMLLTKLLMRASLRQAWRMVKKPIGAIFALFMVAMVSFGVIPTVMLAFTMPDQTHPLFSIMTPQVIALVLFVTAAGVVALGAGDALLELKPAELQFVLAGPFTDSKILSYRLFTLLFGLTPLSLFFSVFFFAYFGSFLGGLLGIFLACTFIILITLQFTLIKPILAPIATQAIRLVALFSVMAIALESSSRLLDSDQSLSLQRVADTITGGTAARILSIPFYPFGMVLGSRFGMDLLFGVLLSAVMVTALTFSCYRSNGGFAELAVDGVARRTKKIERIKGGNIYGFSTRRSERKPLLPMFGWWSGIGPVAWSQITSSIRRTGWMMPGLLIIGTIAALFAAVMLRRFPDQMSEHQRAFAIPIALGASMYVGFIASMTSQTGFLSNRRLLTWYQTLPIPPLAIAIGMVAGSSVMLIIIQVAFCLPAFAVTSQSWIESIAILFAGICFSFAYSTMTNALAVVTDLRPMPQGTPDVFQGARAMVFMLVLGLSLMPLILFAAGAAGIAGALLGFSWVYCSIAAGMTILTILPGIWWYSGKSFAEREFVGD